MIAWSQARTTRSVCRAQFDIRTVSFSLTLRVGVGILVGRIANSLYMPEWRNWQMRTNQNRVGFAHVGSIPNFGIEIITYRLF